MAVKLAPLLALAALAACNAQTCSAQTWSLLDPCAPYYCGLDALSNSGSFVGSYLAAPMSTSVVQLIWTPAAGVTAFTNLTYISDINTSGDIVGLDLTRRAFVAQPPYTNLLYLDTVFNLNTQVFPLAINDEGEILVEPDGYTQQGVISPIYQTLFPGLAINNIFAMNDLGQIIGSYFDPASGNTIYFLYTPGTGIGILDNQPLALSNSGHILTSDANGPYIMTPTGQIRLPIAYWFLLNANDEVVGETPTGAGPSSVVYFSPATGLLKLSDVTPGASGYDFALPEAINDNGEIAILGPRYANCIQGQNCETTVLLFPSSRSPAERARPDLTELKRPRTWTLKGIPVNHAGSSAIR